MAQGAPDGYKPTLLMGVYDGEPTPVAVDEQGRIIMVVEEASPITKTGKVIYRTSFDEGLIRVRTSATGTGASVAVDETEALSGAYSCKLTGGSDGTRKAICYFYTMPGAWNKWGFEFALRYGTDADWLRFYLMSYDGTNYRDIIFQYKPADEKWEIWDENESGFVDLLTGQTFQALASLFYKFKVTIDVENGVYDTFTYPGGSVDLSGYGMLTSADTRISRAEAIVWLQSRAGENDWCLIDDVIITQDEP